MNDIRKLLAGYATGTLTEAERNALFEAALADDELFAALSEEEPLRELLTDPAARSELLARIEPAAPAFRERFAAWLQRPAVMAGFVTAAAAVLVVAIVPLFQELPHKQIAQVNTRFEAPQLTRTPEPVTSTPSNEPKHVSRSTAAPRLKKRQEPQPAAAEMEQPPAPQPAATALPPPPAAAPAGIVARPNEKAELRAGAVAHFVTASDAGSPESTTQRVIVLKKDLSGTYLSIDPATTTLSQGDTVRLRVDPPENGIVRIQGATPQPIVQTLTAGSVFETGDILVGAQDMRLLINFGSSFPAGRPLVSSMRSSQPAPAKSAQLIEILLRVRKP